MPRLTHFAINADNVDATRDFYQRTFGWRFAPWGPPGFYRVEAGDPDGPGITAAIQQRRDLLTGPTTGFECTVGVADVDRTLKSAVAAGGRVLMDRTTIAGVGHLIWLADPSGNVVGAMTYDDNAE